MPVQLQKWHRDWQDQDCFFRQAKLPLRGGCHWTWEVCRWPWNVKSRIKAQDNASSFFQQKAGSPWNTNVYLQLHRFTLLLCTSSVQDPFKPWWLSQSFDSYAAACAVKICAQMCRSTSTAWKNILVTMPVQLQKWHQRDWQDQDGFFRQENYRCMVAAIELEKYAIGHEMSNQDSRPKTRHLPSSNRKLSRLAKLTTGVYLQLRRFTLLLCTCFDSCAAACAVKICSQMFQMTSTALKEHSWRHASTTSKVAPARLAIPGWLFQTSKITAAWWLASNLRSMPLVMTCQIKTQDPRQGIFLLPTESWIALQNWQRVSTYNFAGSLFCSAPVLILAQPPVL